MIYYFRTPVDSPLNTNHYNNNIQQTQMQTHLQQQLNNNNNGRYTQNHLQQQQLRNGRLPDSPPITDISAGGCSSASPSSGSDGSPFTPEQYRNYVNNQNNYNNNNNNGVLLSMHLNQQQTNNNNNNNILAGQTMLLNDDGVFRQMQLHLQQQLSPQSEFLSPYPPSQSTPGSQHSSQVSPPAICNGIQQQQQQQRYMMTPLSVVSNDNYNSIATPQIDTLMYGRETMQIVQNSNGGGHKRRRTTNNLINSNGGSSSGSCASVNNENHCNNLTSIVKSELSPMQQQPQQRLFGISQQQNRMPNQITPPINAPPSVSQISLDEYDEGGLQRTIKVFLI